MITLPLIYKIAELFIIIMLGAVLVRTGIVRNEDCKVLSRISLYLVTPFVVYQSFCQKLTPDIIRGFGTALLMSLCFHCISYLVGRAAGAALNADAVERASVNFANGGNLVVPIVASIFGSEWVIYVAAHMIVFNIVFWTCGIRYFEKGRVDFRKAFLNPNIIAVLLGIVSMVTGVFPPGPAGAAIDDIVVMVGPMSMLIIGIILGGMRLTDILKNKRVFLVVVLRMIVASGIAVLLTLALGIDRRIPNGEQIAMISLLSAIAPTASNVSLLAIVYDKDADYASVINVVTTLTCIVFMPFWIYVFQSVVSQ